MNHLTLVPEGGLCNRIYAITSTVAFVKKYNIRLTVIWFIDKGMGAGFYDLFTCPQELENVEIRDAGVSDFYKYAKPIKRNLFLPKLYQKFKFDAVYFWYKEHCSVEDWYLSHPDAHQFYLFHCQKYADITNLIKTFSLVPAIQKIIDERLKLLSPHTVGIHIRRTDLKAAITHSPLSAFVEKMQQEINCIPETDFYVASDSLEEKKKIKEIFGDKIIIVENNLKRNTKEGVVDALIELYTLASTKKIYGSLHSTYSTLTSEINNIPIEIIQI